MKLASFALSAVVILSALSAQASFEENARRYLSAQELTESLLQYFPQNSNECKEVGSTNSSMLGVSSAISGNPIAPSPTQSTVQWIVGCVSKSLEYIQYETSKHSYIKTLIGAEANTWAEKTAISSTARWEPKQIYAYNLSRPWKEWPADIRSKVISNIVFVLLGSDEVIQDYGLISPDVLRTKLTTWAENNSDKTFMNIVKGFSINLALRDEFLSY